jgi:DNA polymerase-3 subunit alpha
MPAVALTDHGVMYGAIEFYLAAQKAGIKPLIGCEVYVAPRTRFDRDPRLDSEQYHLVLLVQNAQGYRNLCRLVSTAYLEGFYYKPRIDHDLLAQHSEGLIALSACLGAEVPQYLMNGDTDRAAETVRWYQKLFGPDRYYLEVQDHGIPEQQQVNVALANFAEDMGIPLVATNDFHYIRGEDHEMHDVLLCIQTNALKDDPKRMRFFAPEFYFKTPEEMRAQLGSFPRALENTLKIADLCHFEMDLNTTHLPHYECPPEFKKPGVVTPHPLPGSLVNASALTLPLPQGKKGPKPTILSTDPSPSPLGEGVGGEGQSKIQNPKSKIDLTNEENLEDDYDAYLRWKCEQALPRLYPDPTPDLFDRLNYELKVISDKGFSAYMLIVEDFIRFARSKGILAGARGSAAGSLVSYLLGFTFIDPLKWGLLFERFLVQERISPPDIDVDFQDNRRDEIIQYVRDKYGEDKVAQIITFGTMASRAAVRDSARVLGLPPFKSDQIAKLIPFGQSIDEALGSVSELQELVKAEPDVKALLQTAKELVGVPRHASVHAAGVVIGKEPLADLLPLQRMNDGTTVVQFDMRNVEKAGFLKMDFLGLIYLSVLDSTLKLIEQTTGERLDLDHLPLERVKVGEKEPVGFPNYNETYDKTYAMLQRGESAAVFQLESEGMRRLLVDLKPTEFEDLIAVAALYRPGPLTNGDTQEYVRRKHGLNKVSYFHRSVAKILEPILKRTYGLLVYQEQVMRIAGDLAGFSPAKADDLRKAMSKKNAEKMAELRPVFIQGAGERGVTTDVANLIFDTMVTFSAYAFGLNHSAAYAVLAYQTAWLKANYPAQYMAARMTSEMENREKVALYIEESKRCGVEILPPCINRSIVDFSVEGEAIRFGLAAIKGVGRSAIEHILEARAQEGPFTSLADFVSRIEPSMVNKGCLESLIKCGAFDALHPNRHSLLEVMEEAIRLSQTLARERASQQISLLGLEPESVGAKPTLHLPDVPEFEQSKKLALEKELLGLYLSDHPLRQAQYALKKYKPTPIARLSELADRQDVTLGGIVSHVKRSISKSSGKEWMLVTLEDLSGSITVSMFPKTFEQYGRLVEKERILVIKGKTSHRERVRSDEEEGNITVEVSADEVIEISEKALAASAARSSDEEARAPSTPEPSASAVSPSPVGREDDMEEMGLASEPLGEEEREKREDSTQSIAIHVRLPDPLPRGVAEKLQQTLRQYPGSSPVILHKNGSVWKADLRVGYNSHLQQALIFTLGSEQAIWMETNREGFNDHANS